jgi:hypothetical protein
MTDEQINEMANRFLSWRLPADFHPDAGISFKPTYKTFTGQEKPHEPTGTNLFTHTQAVAMIRHMLDTAALSHPAPDVPEVEEVPDYVLEAMRKRAKVTLENGGDIWDSEWAVFQQSEAASDRATLLALLDAERAKRGEVTEIAVNNAAKLHAARVETDSQKRRGDNHWETLRSIRDIARDSGDLERIVQWVNDAGSGYVESNETTMAKLMDELIAARAELAQVREAARPFLQDRAEIADGIPDDTSFSMVEFRNLGVAEFTVGDLRRLAAALKDTQQ